MCCSIPVEETIEHLFLTGEVAARIWNHYFRAAGLLGPMLNLKQTMRKWWSSEGSYRIQVIFQVVPLSFCGACGREEMLFYMVGHSQKVRLFGGLMTLF